MGAFLIGIAVSAPSFGAEPPREGGAPASLVTIPPPPVFPRGLSLSDEFDGRHLFYDTRFAYLKPASLTFEAQWVAVSGAPGDMLPPNHSGSENLASETASHRLSLTSETDSRNGSRTISRTISNGSNLIATRFDQTAGTAAPTRTVLRLQIDDTANLQRSLAQVQVRPETRGGEFALQQTGDILPAAAIVWRAGEETVSGVRAIDVDEFDNREGTTGDGRHVGEERFCRYLIDPDTHRLLRFESWDIDSNHPRPGRRYKPKDISGTVIGQTIDVPEFASTVSYRLETYFHVAHSSAPLNSSLWALTVPDTYKEQPLPSVELPPLPIPPADHAFDPKALTLIRRWREASQRFLTLSASVDVLEHYEPRTAISRSPNARYEDSRVHYEVTIRRPGRAHVTLHLVSGGGRRRMVARDGVAVADGQQAVAVVDGRRGNRPFRDPAPLYSYILQAGLSDSYNALFYLFNPAPDTQFYDRISYDGPQLLDGQPVEVISLHRTLDANRQVSKSETTIRSFLGLDGMPRQIVTTSQSDLNGRLERDQPPTNIRTVHYKNLLLDSTPTVPFTLP